MTDIYKSRHWYIHIIKIYYERKKGENQHRFMFASNFSRSFNTASTDLQNLYSKFSIINQVVSICLDLKLGENFFCTWITSFGGSLVPLKVKITVSLHYIEGSFLKDFVVKEFHLMLKEILVMMRLKKQMRHLEYWLRQSCLIKEGEKIILRGVSWSLLPIVRPSSRWGGCGQLSRSIQEGQEIIRIHIIQLNEICFKKYILQHFQLTFQSPLLSPMMAVGSKFKSSRLKSVLISLVKSLLGLSLQWKKF